MLKLSCKCTEITAVLQLSVGEGRTFWAPPGWNPTLVNKYFAELRRGVRTVTVRHTSTLLRNSVGEFFTPSRHRKSFFIHQEAILSMGARLSPTLVLHREPDMRRYLDPQHLCWQSFCSCRSRAMEQFTTTSQRCWLTVQSVPAVTKDIFVWIVGPRRSANYFNCAV